MKTNRISRRKFLVKLESLVKDRIKDYETRSYIFLKDILQATMSYVKDTMTDKDLGGLCINEDFIPKEIISREDGVTYLKGLDSLEQEFFLFFDDTDSLIGTMTLPDFEIVGGPERTEKEKISMEMDPIENVKPQSIESFVKTMMKGLIRLNKISSPCNYTDVAKKWVEEMTKLAYDSYLVGIKNHAGIPYIHYRERSDRNKPEIEIFTLYNGKGYFEIKSDEEDAFEGNYGIGEDEVPEVRGFEEAFLKALPKEEKKGPDLPSNSIKRVSTEKLLQFKEVLLNYDVAEAKTLLKVVEEEIEIRREELKEIDVEQFRDSYWKLGETHYIKIYEFPDLMGPAKCEVMIKDEETIIKPKPKFLDIIVEKDGSLKGFVKITKEEYEKLSRVFE